MCRPHHQVDDRPTKEDDLVERWGLGVVKACAEDSSTTATANEPKYTMVNEYQRC